MPAVVALALAGWFLGKGYPGAAFLIAAGFDGFLRTGEMLSLTWADVVVEGTSGVIRLAHTKSGQRNAAFEASTIIDPMVVKRFKLALSSLPAGSSLEAYIFLPNRGKFYDLFDEAVIDLGLVDFHFRPYSIRRGGATAHYRFCGSMEATLNRGRWTGVRVARIYVNDGLAKEVELQLPPHLSQRLSGLAFALLEWVSQQQ